MFSLNTVYQKLFACYGPQHWWPGETPFEITIGAILAQNVSWLNAAKAIASLKAHNLLTPHKLFKEDSVAIAHHIKPSGYYNQKAFAIQSFLQWFHRYDFSFDALNAIPTELLRKELLSIKRIGYETADSILLYALHRKVFVVDAYTKRIFTRAGFLTGNEDYMAIQAMFHEHFTGNTYDYNEFHALIVKHGKDRCTKKPACNECCIADECKEYDVAK